MSELEIAERQTKTDLTSTQKESGQYPKGKITLKNIPITIENPKGSYRSGYSKQGVYWKSKLNYTYGYIDGSVGHDTDEIDVFLGPLADTEKDFLVYIINQIDPVTRVFDEHKVMFGFRSSSEAKKAYLSCYEQGWKGLGSIDQISLNGFASWVKNKSNEVFINQLNPTKNEVVKRENENIKLIKLEGEVFENKTLLNLQQQAGDLKGVKTLVCTIGSPGGDVGEGIKIMMWFDYLSSIGIKVVTLVVSNAYSIASLIMLAADHTLIAKDADVMVHNPMIPNLKLVNANELEQHVKELRQLESTMYELYEIFTDLSIGEIKELMDNETYIDANQALKYGFADEIANIEKRPKVLAVSKLKTSNMKKTLNILQQVIALVGNNPIVNQSYYNDKGGEIEIYQQDPSNYSVGDRTSVESGEVTLQDGSVLHIKDFVIESIDKAAPVVEPTPSATEVVEEPVPVVEEPVVSQFNQGPPPAVVEEPAMKTEVTKTETTKTEPVAAPVAVAVVEEPVAVVEPTLASPGATPVVEEEKGGTKTVAEETVVVPAKEFQELLEGYKKLCERVEVLEKGQSSTEEQMKASTKFEEVATEAIEMIAKNTTSSFKPAAKMIVEEAPKGSIFQQARAKVEARGK